jgi:hypothetical protein
MTMIRVSGSQLHAARMLVGLSPDDLVEPSYASSWTICVLANASLRQSFCVHEPRGCMTAKLKPLDGAAYTLKRAHGCYEKKPSRPSC